MHGDCANCWCWVTKRSRDPADRFERAGANDAAAGRGTSGGAPPAAGRRWADYTYAHGGKDGTPFPVQRDAYDHSIASLELALRRARLGDHDRVDALKRLAQWRERAERSA